MRYLIAPLVGALAVGAAWALPAVARHSSPSVQHVTAVTVTTGKPSEFHFALTKKTVPKGTVTFLVMNKGNVPHDFKVLGHKTKLLSPGQTQTLRVTFLKSGTYPYLCTVTGHAVAGMKGTLTVT